MKKKIIVVSLFSNIDFFLKAFVKLGALPGFACEINKWPAMIHAANFLYPDGTPVLTPCMEITWAEVEELKELGRKEKRDVSHLWWKKDGKNYRHKKVEEINGHEIRILVEKIYGPDIIIILIGGPPCTDMSKLNRTNDRGRTKLIFEFLRVLKELDPDVAIMEEAKELLERPHMDTLEKFLQQAKMLPYKIAYMHMNAIHYGVGKQLRIRTVVQFVADRWNKSPVFPIPEFDKAKRVGDLIDVDHWFSGHFTDKIRTHLDFMTTVTSGSPLWFEKNGIKWSPTFDERMLFMGAEKGDFIIPVGVKIPQHELSLAAGNGVCMNLASALASTIFEHILGLRHDGNGFFGPIGNSTSPLPDNNGSDDPIDITLVSNPPCDHVDKSKPETATIGNDCNDPTKTSPASSISIDRSNATNVSKQEDVVRIHSINSKKIISSQQLINMHFETLVFQGRWNLLLGDTSVNFFCVIHGLPGHGKSTIAIQLAKYLADNFGKVLYISGEEGVSKTIKDKFVNNNAASILLEVGDLRTFEEIIRVVPAEFYKYIFIDSLDNMKIDANKMKTIRTKYKNSALITISQSTKAGLMRGSQEIIHDSDIAIEVVNLIATTTKNRFKEKGMTYEIFPEMINLETKEPD